MHKSDNGSTRNKKAPGRKESRKLDKNSEKYAKEMEKASDKEEKTSREQEKKVQGLKWIVIRNLQSNMRLVTGI
jgi:hypothetical protein